MEFGEKTFTFRNVNKHRYWQASGEKKRSIWVDDFAFILKAISRKIIKQELQWYCDILLKLSLNNLNRKTEVQRDSIFWEPRILSIAYNWVLLSRLHYLLSFWKPRGVDVRFWAQQIWNNSKKPVFHKNFPKNTQSHNLERHRYPLKNYRHFFCSALTNLGSIDETVVEIHQLEKIKSVVKTNTCSVVFSQITNTQRHLAIYHTWQHWQLVFSSRL